MSGECACIFCRGHAGACAAASEIGRITGDAVIAACGKSVQSPQVGAVHRDPLFQMIQAHRFGGKRSGLRLQLNRVDMSGRVAPAPQQRQNPAAGAEITDDVPAFRPRKVREQDGVRAETVLRSDQRGDPAAKGERGFRHSVSLPVLRTAPQGVYSAAARKARLTNSKLPDRQRGLSGNKTSTWRGKPPRSLGGLIPPGERRRGRQQRSCRTRCRHRD